MTTEGEAITLDETVRVKTANEWIRQAKKRPLPKQLFGEIWKEGELALLFGDTGHCKTVLATQIAESIAAGRAIEPFEMTAGPQKVLLVDLEMSDKQFETRYSEDHAGGKARYLHNHYRFSDNFERVEIDLEELDGNDKETPALKLVRIIEKIVREKGTTVVILDNITFVKRSYYGARETLPLMKMLSGLKKHLGLSVLVVAHTHRHEFPRGIQLRDLEESRLLGRYADTIFAIGQNRAQMSGCYIKQIKQRSDMLLYTAAHVPVFRLRKIGGNYLGLEFERYSPEVDLLVDIRRTDKWESIEAVKKLTNEGLSIRQIAGELSIPRTSVHRLLKMWRPPAVDDRMRSGPAEFDLTKRDDYFPGCEEYIEAKNDPRFEALYELDEDAYEYRLLSREDYLIELAWADAHEAYKKTGVAPKLNDHSEYSEFIRTVQSGGNPFANDYMPESDDDDDSFPANIGEPEQSEPELPDESVGGLKRAISADGREIFIEEEDTIGRPAIWYAFDAKGSKLKYERDCNGICVTRLDADAYALGSA